MAALHLALIQMRCEKRAMEANLAAMEAYLRDARARGAEIVCFPEACITGYVDPLKYPDALLAVDGPQVARFLGLTRETRLTALAGIIERNPAGKPYITQVTARNGELLSVYRKRTIPEEEAHLFMPGPDAPVPWRHAAGMLGTAICADISDPTVFAAHARNGARLIFEAAAPGLYGEQATRDWRSGYEWWRGECFTRLGGYARELGVFIAVATQAGRTCDEDFPGGGYVFGPDGACLAESGDWSEGILSTTVDIA